jgi:hypothetical protein
MNKTRLEPFTKSSDGYTQIGVSVKNPPEWMKQKAEDDKLHRERMQEQMNKMIFGGQVAN